MIRRDDGNNWLLIPQIEHALLAGEIASKWGNNRVPQFPRPDELTAAVAHHDDGWRAWDNAPRIDPANGIPRSFLEMKMRDATEIWNRSIAVCGDIGPLPGIWVSQHFCWLAEQARESRSDEPEDLQAIEAFLEAQEQLHRRWKFADDDGLIENGFHAVQFFDRLSLWLCCEPRTEPLEIECPDFGPIQIQPLTNNRIGIEPYPLSNASLRLSVAAKQIPARPYTDDAELQRVISSAPSVNLAWTLAAV